MIKLIDILSEEVSSKVLTEQNHPKAPCPIIGSHPTSMFGVPRGKFGTHSGLDLPAPVGTPIYSPEDGVVHYAVDDNSIYNGSDNGKDRCGRRISITHEIGILSGLRTIYCHLSKIDVTEGQTVKKGDLIGLTGGKKRAPGAGNTTKPHLHLGVINKGGKYLNPLDYIDVNRGFDDMVGTQSSQQPISQDYEDEPKNTTEPKKVDRPTTGIPLKGSLKQHLPYISDEELSEIESEIFPKFEEFINNNDELSYFKNKIEGLDIMVSEDKIFYVVKMDEFADILYTYNDGKFELVR